MGHGSYQTVPQGEYASGETARGVPYQNQYLVGIVLADAYKFDHAGKGIKKLHLATIRRDAHNLLGLEGEDLRILPQEHRRTVRPLLGQTLACGVDEGSNPDIASRSSIPWPL